ncbi:MAG: formyl transferase [bacterium]|nr:formyl transferase [bacterium]
MKIVIFTSNALRHKYVANTLAKHADDVLIISECVSHNMESKDGESALIREHFALRTTTEKSFFKDHEAFLSPTLPILYKEVNLPFVYDVVGKYRPDVAFVYGSWIIKEPLLSLIPRGRFINLHLGLSPYYRGAGTNFWSFVNKELEYVGSTLLHIDAGIDTGDIITHVRPVFESGDTVHSVGCKVIQKSALVAVELLKMLKKGKTLSRAPQWKDTTARVYKTKDFTEEVLKKYYKNLEEGIVEEYLRGAQKKIKLISL